LRSNLPLIILICGWISIFESSALEPDKKWEGLLYLGTEYDTNPNQVTDQDVTHQQDFMASAYLNLSKTWDPKDNSWHAKHLAHFYEARYQDNDTLNFRNLGIQEIFTYRNKSENLSLQLKNTLGLDHYDVDDQDFLWSFSYRPELILFLKESKLYVVIEAQLAQSYAYREVNADNEGSDRQIDVELTKKWPEKLFEGFSIGTFLADHDPQLEDLQYFETGFKTSLSLYLQSPKISVLPQFVWLNRSYTTVSGFDRKDEEIELSLHFSRTFKDIHFIDLGFIYTDHLSNSSSYEYDKSQVQLNYGIFF